MGLDMSLNKNIYIGASYSHRNVKGSIYITSEGKEIKVDLSKVSHIVEKVATWRKANHIHKWFVDNVQDGNDDCGVYYVTREQIEKLLRLCREVVSKAKLVLKKVHVYTEYKNGETNDIYKEDYLIENAEEIRDLLPTFRGFLYGTSEYDRHYLDSVKYTISVLDEVLENEDSFNVSYEYSSSW